MMQEEKLKKIQESIRNNWGEIKPFYKILKKHFNCYMFAICNTESTEMLTKDNTCVSLISENIPYFGGIGHISKTTYTTLNEYKQAFVRDLQVLGILAEECLEDYPVKGDTIKVAFFSNFEEGMSKTKEQFHFLRFVPSKNRWMGKAGFSGGIQKLKRGYSIDEITVIDQNRIGIYQLKLNLDEKSDYKSCS